MTCLDYFVVDVRVEVKVIKFLRFGAEGLEPVGFKKVWVISYLVVISPSACLMFHDNFNQYRGLLVATRYNNFKVILTKLLNKWHWVFLKTWKTSGFSYWFPKPVFWNFVPNGKQCSNKRDVIGIFLTKCCFNAPACCSRALIVTATE